MGEPIETGSKSGPPGPGTSAEVLEDLWSGPFGDAYIDRNREIGTRCDFWADLLRRIQPRGVLEVGCNIGGNIACIDGKAELTVGIDVNVRALRLLRGELGTPALRASGRAIPFADSAFDLVLTAGVLIHVDDATLPAVLAEMLRCSGRYVLMAEYFAPEKVEVRYRGQRGALFKRDFGALLEQVGGSLDLRERGELGEAAGFDNATYWLYEKSRPTSEA
ncbi:MAG: pseudaminic acid biosynthesis-associated methylase [Acidimicrobiales bacterium]